MSKINEEKLMLGIVEAIKGSLEVASLPEADYRKTRLEKLMRESLDAGKESGEFSHGILEISEVFLKLIKEYKDAGSTVENT